MNIYILKLESKTTVPLLSVSQAFLIFLNLGLLLLLPGDPDDDSDHDDDEEESPAEAESQEAEVGLEHSPLHLRLLGVTQRSVHPHN